MTTGKIISEYFTRMVRTVLTLIVMLSVMLTGNPVYSACDGAACVTIGSDWSMTLCVDYQGTEQYQFKLEYVPDSSEIFWKMDKTTLKKIQSGSGSCNPIDKDLNVKSFPMDHITTWMVQPIQPLPLLKLLKVVTTVPV